VKITLFDNPTVVWRPFPKKPQRISAYRAPYISRN